jgi:hypothetical protein
MFLGLVSLKKHFRSHPSRAIRQLYRHKQTSFDDISLPVWLDYCKPFSAEDSQKDMTSALIIQITFISLQAKNGLS